MKDETREVYSEIITVLNHMETKYQDKIPKKLISFFEKNSSKEYKFNIDLDVPFKEQKLKDKTIVLLAILNLNYWCETEEEKQELIKLYTENEQKYQKELREKYNPDNIFKKRNEENRIEENNIQNENVLAEYKEPIFRRFINKIKNIFHIK